MPAPKNNRNAAKPDAERLAAHHGFRSTAAEAAAYRRAAKRAALTKGNWIRSTLNASLKP